MTVTISGTSGVSLCDTNSVTTAALQANSVTQPKVGSGVASSGPIFSAYNNASQTGIVSAAATLVVVNTIEFDTASRFNATGSTVGGIPAYAFMPNVAGYYVFTGANRPTAGATLTSNYMEVWKNGAVALRIGFELSNTANSASFNNQASSSPIYMNGTTDYVQLYNVMAGTGTLALNYAGIPYASRFSGYLVRSA